MFYLFMATLAIGAGVIVVQLAKRGISERVFPAPTGEPKGVAGMVDVETRKQISSEEVDG